MKVVCFGEIMLRLSPSGHYRLSQSPTLGVSFAGAEANVAVSLANYGADVDYVTCLPSNPIADRCMRELRSFGVGTTNILRSGNRMGLIYVEPGSNMRPSKVYYDRAGSSIADIKPGSFNWTEILQGADWFHWTGITPALSANAAEECLNAIQTAKALGITVSCDINHRANLWQYGKQASEVMPKMVQLCDLIIGNEEDCEKVFGIKPEGFDAAHTGGVIDPARFTSVCSQMMEFFPNCKKMAVTLRGAINANHNTWSGILYDGKKLLSSTSYDITDIVDRVGGGDSFVGALIYGIHTFNDDQHALDFATAASALKHTIQGDYNMVGREEVENLLNGDTSGRVKR